MVTGMSPSIAMAEAIGKPRRHASVRPEIATWSITKSDYGAGGVVLEILPPGERRRRSHRRGRFSRPGVFRGRASFEGCRFSGMKEMARVLVAEDDEDILLLLETVLEDAGFAVAATSNVAAAMRVLEAGDVDCVLTDLGLPGQSGMVLAEAAAAAGIPVIVATGGLPESEALAAAGWQLLQKPFRLEDLITMIATALATRPGAGPVIREFLETMAERCRLLADRAEGDALARELMIIADEMRSRAAGAP